MAHFARIHDGIVHNVIVVNNDTINGGTFPDSEPLGQEFIAALPDLSALEGEWRQCSYSASFRGVYPGVGYSWDGTNFIAPVIPEPAIPEVP